MSFNSNNINNTINLGNYEEFFILYLDNELSDAQVKMVNEFLLANPDLQAELEVLKSTKLPDEEVLFDKSSLLASSMMIGTSEEELLLYIDNELPGDQRKVVELELASNNNYRNKLDQLLKTRLDASERISYPDKKELYRRDSKVIVLHQWMRVAAAVLIIAALTMVYVFSNNEATNPQIPAVAVNNGPEIKQQTETAEKQKPLPVKEALDPQKLIASSDKKETRKVKTQSPSNRLNDSENQKNLDQADVPESKRYMAKSTDFIKAKLISGSAKASIALANKEIINTSIGTSPVTSLLGNRNTYETATHEGDIAKGSIKGFLRKATRLIERRTGIDPTNDNGELLIGAVAVKLK